MNLSYLLSQPIGYNGHAKAMFHRRARSALKSVVNYLGLSPDQYALRSNRGGVAVSGEVVLHADSFYIQVSQSTMGRGADVLYRRCQGRRDFHGMANNYCSAALLENTRAFSQRLSQLVGYSLDRSEAA